MSRAYIVSQLRLRIQDRGHNNFTAVIVASVSPRPVPRHKSVRLIGGTTFH